MTCARCDDLREEVRHLKRLMSVRTENAHIDALCVAFGLTHAQAWLVATLYAENGVVSRTKLLDNWPKYQAGERDDAKLVDVVVCKARQRLPQDTIRSVYGRGYMLTPQGREKVAEVVG